MPVSFRIEPPIQTNQPYSLDIKYLSQSIRAKRADWPIAASDALDKVQNSVNLLEKVLRQTQANSVNELIITNAQGVLIGWIGSRSPYFGAWFKQLYVGGTGPDTAPFFANAVGDVIIGKNGSLALQDGGGNEVGWLGVQADAPKTITGATNATPVVVTVAAHGYETGDTVFITGVGGNTATNGYRIAVVLTVNTFSITDLSGVNVAGNGAYTTGGTSTRYFGGGRFQTMAIGVSFTNYKLRAYADGQLKIKDALITLTDVANNGYIELNPSTGPTALFQNTLSGGRVKIFDGFISLSNYLFSDSSISIGYSGLNVANAALDIIISLSDNAGAGQVNISDASGSGTIGLSGATGEISAFIFDAGTEYRIAGVPGIDNTVIVPTGLTVNTNSAITNVDFGAMSTTSDTFVQSITFTDVTLTTTKGLLTAAV